MGRDEALGRRAVKLVGAPIESGPGCIWVGRATAAATLEVLANPWPGGLSLEAKDEKESGKAAAADGGGCCCGGGGGEVGRATDQD